MDIRIIIFTSKPKFDDLGVEDKTKTIEKLTPKNPILFFSKEERNFNGDNGDIVLVHHRHNQFKQNEIELILSNVDAVCFLRHNTPPEEVLLNIEIGFKEVRPHLEVKKREAHHEPASESLYYKIFEVLLNRNTAYKDIIESVHRILGLRSIIEATSEFLEKIQAKDFEAIPPKEFLYEKKFFQLFENCKNADSNTFDLHYEVLKEYMENYK